MSPRANRRANPPKIDADKQYRDGWNDGWRAGMRHAEASAAWGKIMADIRKGLSRRKARK